MKFDQRKGFGHRFAPRTLLVRHQRRQHDEDDGSRKIAATAIITAWFATDRRNRRRRSCGGRARATEAAVRGRAGGRVSWLSEPSLIVHPAAEVLIRIAVQAIVIRNSTQPRRCVAHPEVREPLDVQVERVEQQRSLWQPTLTAAELCAEPATAKLATYACVKYWNP